MAAEEKPRPDPLLTRQGWQVAAPSAAAVTATSGSLFGVPGMVATAGVAAGAAGVAAWRERQSRAQRRTGKAASRVQRRPVRRSMAARLPGLGPRSPAAGVGARTGSGLPRLGLGRAGGKGAGSGGKTGGASGSSGGAKGRGLSPLRGLGLGRGTGAGSSGGAGKRAGTKASTGAGSSGRSGRGSGLRGAFGGGSKRGSSGGSRGSGRGSGSGSRGSGGRSSGSSGASRGGAVGRALRRLTGRSGSSGKGRSSGGGRGSGGGSPGAGKTGGQSGSARKAGLVSRAIRKLRGGSSKKGGKRWTRPRWVGRIFRRGPKPKTVAAPAPRTSPVTTDAINKALAPSGQGRRTASPAGEAASPIAPSPIQGGAMAPNPFTAVVEACAQAARAYSPDNALRVIEWYEGMPDMIDAIASMLRAQGQKTSEEFYLYPAATEFAVALGDQFLKYKAPCEEARLAFLSAHNKDVARIKEPQRNQEKWDISANRD